MHLAEASSVGAMLLCLRAQVVKPFAPGQVLPSMWTALLNQTSGLQGCCDVSCGILAGSDPGTGSGWQQSRPNRTPLCSDEIVSPNATAAPLSSSRGVSLHRFLPPVPGKACCTSPPTSTLRRQKAPRHAPPSRQTLSAPHFLSRLRAEGRRPGLRGSSRRPRAFAAGRPGR